MDLIDRDELLKEYDLAHCVKYGNKDAKQQYHSYDTLMMYEIADMIRDVPAVNRWIPCSERMPEQDGEYLVFTEYEDVFKCTFDSNEENKWGFEQNYHDPDTLGWAGTTWTAVETVTHWMPLPEPPEGGAEDG